MNRDRALEIIAAYGGDALRWPATETTALLALADGDRDVAKALVEARQLDTLLGDWAQHETLARIDIAAITRQPAVARVRAPARRWLVGGLAAAAMAAGIAFMAPMQPAADPQMDIVSAKPAAQLATAGGEAPGNDADAFATVFTPTVDEDALI